MGGFRDSATALLEQNRLPEAARLAEAYAERQVEAGGNDPWAAYDLAYVDYLLASRGDDMAAATDALRRSLAAARRTRSQATIEETYNQLATHFYTLGEVDSAAAYFTRLIEYKRVHSSAPDLLDDWSLLGKINLERGAYLQAQRYLMDALRAAEGKRDTFYMMDLCSDLAELFALQAFPEQSRRYAHRAIRLAEAKRVGYTIAVNELRLGDLYASDRELDQAEQAYRRVLAVAERVGHTRLLGDVHMAFARLYRSDENLDSSRTYLLRARSIRESSGDALGLSRVELALGELALLRSRLPEALRYFTAAARGAGATKQLEVRARAHAGAATAYARLGDPARAYEELKENNLLERELSSQQQTRALADLELVYETEKKDREIERQGAELQLANSAITEARTRSYILYGAVATTTLLALLLLLLYRQNKEVSRQRIALLTQQRETTAIRSVLEGEERERTRISRDLHDGLGALLATAKMRLEALGQEVATLADAPSYRAASGYIDEACTTVREVSHNLSPATLTHHGLSEALALLCDEVDAAKADLRVSYIALDDAAALSPDAQVALYRVTQELLTNAVRHAGASHIVVQMSAADQLLTLIVEDDGVGFDVDPAVAPEGIGLRNVDARVRFLGGTVAFDSRRGVGTTVTIEVPVPAHAHHQPQA